ncbi:MAG: M14 family metallopeptidase [Saprospiraceae bacterium]
MRSLFTFCLFGLVCCSQALQAQKQAITYYLPDINYNPAIPTPEQVLGYQIGEWHISHDQLLYYMRTVAAASPRMTLTEHGRTYENRPLIHLTVTSEKNHSRLAEIKAQHRQLSDPGQSASLNIDQMPAVIYQGYSIHGNEPSGANASAMVAYYLAAAESPEVLEMLDNVVIIFDPSFNPDGLQRFSTWANMHKNANLTSDSQDREYDESWPGGRTNHYWFDLNRDWLPLQLPESQGRIKVFHDWKPNILTDHHEMGSNSTFFFMPGESTRVHPITPKKNQELTAKIGEFHQAALDKIGSMYFSGEGYDDFYYGKGSTYPDANGCIGILFEQASSRGHLQETDNGLLSFAFTIRNQVTTALSTYAAAKSLRKELLSFQRDFYLDGMKQAAQGKLKGIVFGDAYDASRAKALVKILQQHEIKVHHLKPGKTVKLGEKETNQAYVVPLDQPQYHLIRGMFDSYTSFEDSLFYDISAWTLPLAFNLPYQAIADKGNLTSLLGAAVVEKDLEAQFQLPKQSNYAYLMRWDDYYAPKALNQLLAAKLRVKVSTEPFVLEGQSYDAGTIFLPVQNQDLSPAEIHALVVATANSSQITITAASTGWSPQGPDLGSSDMRVLAQPQVLLMVGEGVSSYDAGEAWHLLDQRYQVVVTKGETTNFSRMNIDRYNVIIMVEGSYNSLGKSGADKLKEWVSGGGTLIAMKRAVSWAASNGLANVLVKKEDEEETKGRRPYGKLSSDNGGKVVGGAIAEVNVDLTHPLLYGYHQAKMPVFRRGSFLFEPAQNPYATPMVYTDKPLLSGYIHKNEEKRLANAAATLVSGMGRGKVICMSDNPNFRAFWYGTNKLFANAIFFGGIISSAGAETKPPKKAETPK